MKIRIDFTIEVAPERLAALYEFMQTDREGIRDALADEAGQYITEYLDGNDIPNKLVRGGFDAS